MAWELSKNIYGKIMGHYGGNNRLSKIGSSLIPLQETCKNVQDMTLSEHSFIILYACIYSCKLNSLIHTYVYHYAIALDLGM